YFFYVGFLILLLEKMGLREILDSQPWQARKLRKNDSGRRHLDAVEHQVTKVYRNEEIS
ncbi:hypothetical protein MKW92_030073, partial [Papaver armeniacum]